VPGDPLVDRIGRSSLIICVLCAVVALALWGGRVAGGVLGGGLLIAISFYTLGHGVAALVVAATGGATARQAVAGALLKLVLRYALLGFLAYVMIARLRLHPMGLLAGASSVAAGAVVEAVRLFAKNRP
ncbi:MAG: ATP synthase subunit I, partial [Chloroflexota bacterium]|nr:ATP synthase subunit I [Chloroflexota bacterium]